MIRVKNFYAFNDLRNYSYLIYDDQTGDSWVIDPYEAMPIIDEIKKQSLNLRGILNTHQHFDHIRGNLPLHEVFMAPVMKLRNGDSISLGSMQVLEVLDTPGHTMDHQAFIWKTQDKAIALFSGDTLFNAGVGNCRNGGNVEALYETTKKIVEGLPGETLLYPGHDYVQNNLKFSLNVEPGNRDAADFLRQFGGLPPEKREPFTLDQEKKVNPFLRLDSEDLRQNLDKSKIVGNDDKIERNLFYQLRTLRDKW